MNIRISTKGKRPLRSLTPSDKVHAIQRIHDGESKASVARDIGVPESTLRGWCKNEDKLRFMSRQAAAEKLGTDSLSDKLDGGPNMLGGPPEKRQRVDPTMALNFSNKIKFDELNTYKRAPINGLDFSTSKALTELGNFNSLASDYGAFNGSAKTKLYGADISRPTDPAIAAISPLSSLTHLSGLTGLTQSPLAISFNELTTNLTLLAQLNPGLAAMSGLTASGTALRNNTSKPKSQSQIHSPRSEATERQAGLTVKNWAKQNHSTPTSSDSCGLNLCQKEANIQMKSPNTPLIAHSQIGAALPPLSSLPEDPLLYWLKSQQNILGLNNIYPHAPPLGAPSPPIRSSTPQNQHASTPPIIPNTLTPSSTPSGSLDDKNAAWFNWCKAFGASLNSLAPAAVVSALQGSAIHHTSQSPGNSSETDKQITAKVGFENILYSHLTKDSISNLSPQSSPSIEQVNSEVTQTVYLANRPEDLSAKVSKGKSSISSPLPNPALSPIRVENQLPSSNSSSVPTSVPETHINVIDSDQLHVTRNSVADCKDVLDNLLYKINNNPNAPSRVSDSDASYKNDQRNVSYCSVNNNNNSNKTDEEEWAKCTDIDYEEEMDADSKDAIRHGEKFLKWLENCSNPRVTAVQLMQLRFLISSIKEVAETTSKNRDATLSSNHLTAIEIDDSSEEGNRSKTRRRK